ncbi:ATP-binding protein [Streptomyces erythrochromogenes]|uniref:ATP-binding protein n=1 Tax=Streptomyces erythrochromogenes TaxID=285574 RepID=A0ABZ1Q5H2_9ACTN|nr:AAA family ATPase [Streptomyces erythrochromogenes]
MIEGECVRQRGALGDVLEAARDRAFVGRNMELALFRSALAGETGACPVHFLHGPGGIGKSTLVRRLAREGLRAGRAVIEVDGRTVAPTPQGFTAAVGDIPAEPGVVLLVDTFERCQGLEGWLRNEFLLGLPLGSVVVLAGRRAPDARWTSDPGWSQLLRVTSLRNLPPDDAARLLHARGLPAGAHQAVLSFTGGNPLALSLAAAVAVREEGGVKSGWKPSQDVIATLLSKLLGDIPTPAHRRALEICAHSYVTSESLLRALVGAQAPELFAWLRQQPFIEATDAGLFPHDVVREALEADLRWRDPDGFADMHRAVHQYLVERVRTVSDAQLLQATSPLIYLYRKEASANFHKWRDGDHVKDEPYAEEDRERVLELAETAEGGESADICRFWLDHQPEAFRVYRSTQTGEIVAFFAWLRLREPLGADIDPIVDAAWAHARSAAPLRPGEYIALARFHVHPPVYQRTSPPMDLMHWRGLGEIFRADRQAWTFVVKRDDGHWDAYMHHFAMPSVGRRPRVGPHPYVLFGHDWRAQPVGPWLEERSNTILAHKLRRGASSSSGEHAELVVLSRPEFDTAVRDALRAIRRPDALARNPLNHSRVVTQSATALRTLLINGIDALREGRSGDKHHRALTTTYIAGALTQEAAAERLGLPFSTYRRHLTSGIERLIDLLWRSELNGTAVTGGDPT